MRILRLILFPFSIIFGAVVIIRNLLFDIRIIKTYKSSIPVISVGNITTGGTGKTPVVIMLTGLLLNSGKSVCVISRGYGRKTQGLIIGFDGKDVKGGAEDTGDETSMIINRFCGFRDKFFALSDSKRVNAVKYAEKNFKPDVVILDDAYQHRYIKRDLDMVVVNTEQNRITDKTLLPAGNLREPFACLCRADLIIRNSKFSKSDASYPLNTVPEIRTGYEIEGYFNINGERLSEKKSAIVALSGIADNDSFFDTLKKDGFEIRRVFSFKDHNDYSEEDIKTVTQDYGKETIFITTEKDFIKLKNFSTFTENYNLYYLRLKVLCDDNLLTGILKNKKIL
ncbi:MAG: tetraacyldisaccharide 4'-kinase [Bacteroidetes bacterium]|nr:tetraacyldisaccharide 4'-kinase [Bacteroidota bacterium]